MNSWLLPILLALSVLADSGRGSPRIVNPEASTPPQCYTKTDGNSNPCWSCHSVGVGPNTATDVQLQDAYSFSDAGLDNPWLNLFRDRKAERAQISDRAVLEYIRQSNLQPLRSLLDFDQGFDDLGFACDGSGWRAVRFQPLPGAFWPTNGATDDVFVRLPVAFRSTQGHRDREVYRLNLAVLEAAIAADPRLPGRRVDRRIEPLREIEVDLDGDGQVAIAQRVEELPDHFFGDACGVRVERYLFPQGTEFLHTVRYLDPDAPDLRSRRVREVRYSRKVEFFDAWARLQAREDAADERDSGRAPTYVGAPAVGYRNGFGWQLQGWIENASGDLRLQSAEEHLPCLGCHGTLGITVDHTFAFARKVPGAEGWRVQDLRGLVDRPQVGHPRGEVETYLARVGGGDGFRSNDEMLERFFVKGILQPDRLEGDLRTLLAPSRRRALELNKATWLIVREQSYRHGRDPVLAPVTRVHRRITEESTGLTKAGRVYGDGRLWLEW